MSSSFSDMHRTRNSLTGVLRCFVLSYLILNYLKNWLRRPCMSRTIPAGSTELGSKMVAARFRTVPVLDRRAGTLSMSSPNGVLGGA
jgi:hypothetical protein